MFCEQFSPRTHCLLRIPITVGIIIITAAVLLVQLIGAIFLLGLFDLLDLTGEAPDVVLAGGVGEARLGGLDAVVVGEGRQAQGTVPAQGPVHELVAE